MSGGSPPSLTRVTPQRDISRGLSSAGNGGGLSLARVQSREQRLVSGLEEEEPPRREPKLDVRHRPRGGAEASPRAAGGRGAPCPPRGRRCSNLRPTVSSGTAHPTAPT
ncbi:hypothetical protein NDU88_011918 [Pleurodeles waltl]|uniref:Uncharacterized protein n=1 Tax=Pleurodeles waltl TaxID=8319 RepID=A0AAV7S6B5_PLEWA|nr:hypothetical protein NDU88_011918 [Pleurodeles waltl]